MYVLCVMCVMLVLCILSLVSCEKLVCVIKVWDDSVLWVEFVLCVVYMRHVMCNEKKSQMQSGFWVACVLCVVYLLDVGIRY